MAYPPTSRDFGRRDIVRDTFRHPAVANMPYVPAIDGLRAKRTFAQAAEDIARVFP